MAIFVAAFSLFEALMLPLSRLGVLAVALFVSVLISQYRIKIPRTSISFSPKNIFAFWGTMWVGVPGAVLLGAAASMSSNGFKIKDRRSWLASVSTDVAATFFSAIAYYMVIGFATNDAVTVLAGGLNIPNEIIIGAVVMAFTHYLQHSAISYLFLRCSVQELSGSWASELLLHPAAGYLVTLASTIVLFLTFNHFGIEFGLVILPLAIAGHLAYTIYARSLAVKTKQISESSRIHLATVEALATAIDARDQVGIGHVRRTQIYAVGIGNILGLTEDEINALRTGALLHDIGKLAVPDHILNKQGRLTPAEVEKTKTHSSVGASILEKVGFPYPVVPTVKYHHECWDGTGYPEALRGVNIPLTARILAVADSYDTLRGARGHHAAVSRDEACKTLRAGAGGQFDPNIVDIFLRNLRIFEKEIDAQDLKYELDPTIREMRLSDADIGSTSYVEQIKQANREVFTLYSLARDFSSAITLDATLSLFTAKVGEFVPFDTCLVYLLDEAKEFATAVHVEGRNHEALNGKRIKVGEGATGYVLKKSKAVENVDPSLDFAFSHMEFSREYIAMASIPLMADEKLIGAISLYSSELPHYQDEHLRLLETVSRIAADAICKSQQHAQTETHALTDPMTGLPNARSLQMHFDKEVKRASRAGHNFQVLVLDLDGFKAVNDTHGHKAGDKMLKEIGKAIRGELRDYDFLARYGGDEFVAIVPETHSADVLELCKRIETAVNDFALPVSGEAFARVGVSIGAASYPNHGETFDQLIISADKAMYMTKAFHKKRNLRLEEQIHSTRSPENEKAAEAVRPASSRDLEFAEAKIAEALAEEGLIVELDETHIVSSAAVN